jgi:hypothetical protein
MKNVKSLNANLETSKCSSLLAWWPQMYSSTQATFHSMRIVQVAVYVQVLGTLYIYTPRTANMLFSTDKRSLDSTHTRLGFVTAKDSLRCRKWSTQIAFHSWAFWFALGLWRLYTAYVFQTSDQVDECPYVFMPDDNLITGSQVWACHFFGTWDHSFKYTLSICCLWHDQRQTTINSGLSPGLNWMPVNYDSGHKHSVL